MGDAIFSISRHSGLLIQNLDFEQKLQKFNLVGSSGNNARTAHRNLTGSFSVTGAGDVPVILGFQPSLVTGVLSGLVSILSIKITQENLGWEKWTYSGEVDPYATAVA